MAKDIKIGIVGAAGRGRSFFSAFTNNPRTQITALCDINEEGIRRSAAEIGVEQVYTDYETMLDKSGIDAVMVGTPMPLHVPQAIAALDRGIHTITEVPAGVSIEECRKLVESAKRSKAVYMMAENYCYIRSNVLVKHIARAGAFGEIYHGEGAYIHELKELNEITKWRRKWQTGINGNTYPTHSLGPVYQWFGNVRVTKVCCYGSGHHFTDPRGDQYEQEDTVTTACRMANGGLVELRLDMLSNRPHNMTYYSVTGTNGSYESARGFGDKPKIYLKDRHGEPALWHDLEELAEEFLPDEWLNQSEEARKAGHGGGDYMEILDFVKAIADGAQPPIGIHEAMDMTLPGLVSQQSIEQGSVWLDVPDSRDW
jgi:predicted dehydrogenase